VPGKRTFLSWILLAALLWLGPTSALADPLRPLCERVTSEILGQITTLEKIETQFGKVAFVTKRQNRLFKNLFTAAPSKGYLALSIDFPIVKQLNNTFDRKSTTSAVFNSYKAIFFRNLEADPVLSGALLAQTDVAIRYADFKNIGLIFSHDSPELREHIAKLQEKTARDYHELTGQIPELKQFDESKKSIVRNRMSWVTYGLGANPLQASAASRLGRYHAPATGLSRIRDFREEDVQQELRQKFADSEIRRKNVIDALRELGHTNRLAKDMFIQVAHRPGVFIPSGRLWDVLRKVDAPDKETYLAHLKKGIQDEFRVTVPDSLLPELQSYYHLLDNFLPRVHERKEADIEVGDGEHGVMYVDIRGQTPRNLVRMAEEMASVADELALGSPDLPELAAMAVRRGQDHASRKFDKIRKAVRTQARKSGVKSPIKISGDEIVIPLHEGEDTATFSTYVALLGKEGVPARPLLVSGGSVKPTNAHVSDCETIEKALRAKLKTASSMPVHSWEDLTIGIRLEPSGKSGGKVTIFLSEREGTERVEKARELLTRSLAKPEMAKEMLPEGYDVTGLMRARVHEVTDIRNTGTGR